MAALSFEVMPDAVRARTVQGLSAVSADVSGVGESLSGSSTLTAAQAGHGVAAAAIDAFRRRSGVSVSGTGSRLGALGRHVDVAMGSYRRSDDASADELSGLLGTD